ncbi:MAG: hypothetical protein IID45_02280 [Planctomycetes bacterium]|nr:hypothetical protein [Planctomycetota bacterium]
MFGIVLILAFVGLSVFLVAKSHRPTRSEESVAERRRRLTVPAPGRQEEIPAPRFPRVGNITLWWDDVPKDVLRNSVRVQDESNIRLSDYSGPESCRDCHSSNYEKWSVHPHRWMNAEATPSTLLGDFSGNASLSYLKGTARFYQKNGTYRMELTRGSIRREYRIMQTIGSRFQQYYVGRLLSGPEPRSHPAYSVNHLLPFGYWLSRKMWVPTVHIGSARVEGKKGDEDQFWVV